MQDFTDENEKTNSHFGNIEFVCADVMQLTREKESAYLVFSNWLLMYLEDKETQQLMVKLLSWLTPGGYLFIRESCRHPSGNMPRGLQNPTRYRNPEVYSSFLVSTTIPGGGDSVYGFDLVLSKSVETYVKLKNNNNQVVWLVQKVKRDTSKYHGFQTFQEFLDNQQYSATGILCYEKIFGRTFVCPGGIETTKKFVDMLQLQPGQRVLDVGGGIGGSAFYMAKEFGVKVVSIDLSSNMIATGHERARELGIGPNQVSFEIADATKREYPPQSFDVIYSREAILHMKDKVALFKKLFKWLKPGGKVLISDYCCGEGKHSGRFLAYVMYRGYHLYSPSRYGKLLEEAGFVDVRVEDRTHQFSQLLEKELKKAQSNEEDIIKEFSEVDYHGITKSWKDKLVWTAEGDLRWGLFYAEKP